VNLILFLASLVGACSALGAALVPQAPASGGIATLSIVVAVAACTWLILRWIDDPAQRKPR
jgi:Na+-translocating ferredoxin:NAD+ oxidoreductase RnfA subunit